MGNKGRQKKKIGSKKDSGVFSIESSGSEQQHGDDRPVFAAYNERVHRHLLPFRPGQTMVVADIGLEVLQCFPNGDFVLRPKAVRITKSVIVFPSSAQGGDNSGDGDDN